MIQPPLPPPGNPREIIDLVLPLAVQSYGNSDLERCKLLLRSLELRFDPASLGAVFIVCQAGKQEIIEAGLRDFSLPLRFLDERELIGEPSVGGWRKQQMIKLVISERVSEFYLVFDADILCHRAVRYQDLVPDGRSLLGQCPKHIFRDWYTLSSETLGIKVDWDTPGIGVTPQILSREVVSLLRRHLERRWNEPWMQVLGRSNSWTEFTLYWLILEHYRLFDLFHVWGEVSGACAWNRQEFDRWSLTDDAEGFFSVVQSNLGFSSEVVRQRLPESFLAG